MRAGPGGDHSPVGLPKGLLPPYHPPHVTGRERIGCLAQPTRQCLLLHPDSCGQGGESKGRTLSKCLE